MNEEQQLKLSVEQEHGTRTSESVMGRRCVDQLMRSLRVSVVDMCRNSSTAELHVR